MPHDEVTRQITLDSLNILDMPPMEQLDRVTRLAAGYFKVTTALVSLIDENRQWFLSRFGLDATETPRNISFCGHAILQNDTFIVPDTKKDERFADNPLVTGIPFIRSYAGQPVYSKQGYALGTLCLIDENPHSFSINEINALKDFASMVEQYLQSLEVLIHSEQVQKNLNESEQLFEQTFTQSAVGMALVSLDGTWLRVNPFLCHLLGYSESELLQKTFQDITHPDDLGEDLNNVDKLLHGVINNYTMEKRYICADQSYLWISLTVALNKTIDGQPHHFITVIKDINEQKIAEQALLMLQQELEQRVYQRTKELELAVKQLNQEIEQRIAVQGRLNAQKERFRLTLENTSDAFVEINDTGKIIGWNPSAERIFGWSHDEAMNQSLDTLLIPAAMRDQHKKGFIRYQASGQSKMMGQRLQLTAQKKDGTEFPVEMTLNENTVDGKRFVTAFLHDISERVRFEKELLESRLRLQTIADNMPALICHVDRDLNFIFANKTYESWFGLSSEQLKKMKLSDIITQDKFDRAKIHLENALQGISVTYERKLVTAKKEIYLQVTLIPAQGGANGIYILAMDISELKALQAMHEYNASHDVLTKLPNRRAFTFLLDNAINTASQKDKGLALLFLDLDNFKTFNDTYGHEFGDRVLTCFADVIKGTIRETDIVARLAGDEFTVILTELNHPDEGVHQICDKLLTALKEVQMIEQTPVTLSASIGAAICYAGDKTSIDVLMSKADAAMYRAKEAGKGIYSIN
ncbi:PAS domain S-box protein [uncultured Tolumonas sp.]|uniref:PAS domain S-box protein n=1 Tax=uncultured Tolumonas sp. TaxID=263765 RepID=UPI002930C64C|nr:PAS domain S-box protein [uncultured Tolumonas sp.]